MNKICQVRHEFNFLLIKRISAEVEFTNDEINFIIKSCAVNLITNVIKFSRTSSEEEKTGYCFHDMAFSI